MLKSKFDDVFAATKYTKALEAFRKLKAEKMAEYKVGGGGGGAQGGGGVHGGVVAGWGMEGGGRMKDLEREI